MPHLLAQFTEKLVVSEEDKNLIMDYNPITAEGVKNDSNILKTLENPIDQCKFCPEKYEYSRIFQKKIA